MQGEVDRFLRRPVRSLAQLPRTIGSRRRLRAHGHLRRIRFRDVRRRRALLLRCILVRWRASRGLEADTSRASCDRLCRADDALGRSIDLKNICLAGDQQGSGRLGQARSGSMDVAASEVHCGSARAGTGWSGASVAGSGGLADWLPSSRTKTAA